MSYLCQHFLFNVCSRIWPKSLKEALTAKLQIWADSLLNQVSLPNIKNKPTQQIRKMSSLLRRLFDQRQARHRKRNNSNNTNCVLRKAEGLSRANTHTTSTCWGWSYTESKDNNIKPSNNNIEPENDTSESNEALIKEKKNTGKEHLPRLPRLNPISKPTKKEPCRE